MSETISKNSVKMGRLLVAGLLVAIISGLRLNDSTIREGMVRVPAGQYSPFYKNSADTIVQVPSFLMDAYAVTNAEYLEFVKANPTWAKSRVPAIYADTGYLKHWESDFEIGDHYNEIKNSPVTNISWFAANAYSQWKGKRLPTIEEWEYAGSAAIESAPSLEKVILDWYSRPTPAILPPVGTTFKNEFDLYDMHGLVWEWVYDFNSIVMDGDSRSNEAIKRNLFCASGSFGAANKEDYAAFMRFAYRGSLKANYTVSNLGFRCAKTLE